MEPESTAATAAAAAAIATDGGSATVGSGQGEGEEGGEGSNRAPSPGGYTGSRTIFVVRWMMSSVVFLRCGRGRSFLFFGGSGLWKRDIFSRRLRRGAGGAVIVLAKCSCSLWSSKNVFVFSGPFVLEYALSAQSSYCCTLSQSNIISPYIVDHSHQGVVLKL